MYLAQRRNKEPTSVTSKAERYAHAILHGNLPDQIVCHPFTHYFTQQESPAMSGMPAARQGDTVVYGVITKGSATVLIGDAGGGGGGGGNACSPKSCEDSETTPQKGCPVNPVLGSKILIGASELDFALPGALPIVWQRQYSSYVNAEHGPQLGLLGFGWTLPLEVRAQITASACLLFDAGGRVITFGPLAPGATLYSVSEDIHLLRGGPSLPQQLAKALEAAEAHRRLAAPAKPDVLAYAARWRGLTALSVDQLADPAYLFATSGNVIWAFRQTNAECFDLRSLIDRYGRRQTHLRDDTGRLIELQDGVGRRYGLRYDSVHPGRKASAPWPADAGLRLVGVDLLSDPLAPEASTTPLVTYRYNPEGDLISVIDRHGEEIRSFAYRQHSLVFHRHRHGPEHRYTYESDQPGARVVEQRNQEGLSYRFDYLDTENAVLVTDNLGREERYQFQGKGGLKRLIEHLRPDGSRLRFKYDAAGRLVARIDPLERTTYFRLDAEGRLLAVAGPGGTNSASFDASGRLIETETPGGRRTRMAYDDWDRLIEVEAPDGSKTRYRYPDPKTTPLTCDHPVEIIDTQGGIKRLSWNSAGQMLAYTDCAGRSTRYRYDRWGDLLETTDPLGHITRHQRDAQNRLVSLTQADGSTTQYRYNAQDRLAEEQDALGRITAFSYDLWGRLTSRRQGAAALALEYDIAGRLTTLTNENQAQTRFTYDPLDRLTREVGFDGRVQDYRYDPAGRLLDVRDGLPSQARSTGYGYDEADRLIERRTARTDFAEAQTHRYLYDRDGLLLKATVFALTGNETGEGVAEDDLPKLSEVEITRDELGRSVRETQRLYTSNADTGNPVEFEYALSHRYSPLGHRTGAGTDLGELDWLTYGSGHVHGLSHQQQPLIDLDRDAGHREIARKLANGVNEHRRLDPLGRLLSQGFAHESGPALPERAYAYDPAGQLLGIKWPGFLGVYAYDPQGRLIASRVGSEAEVRYRFDPAGNRLPDPMPEAIKQVLPDWSERVQQNLDNPDFNLIGQDPLEREAMNKQVSRWPLNRIGHNAGIRYRYDAWGNRIEAIQPDGVRQRFGYDGLHRLVRLTTPQVETRYRYDAFGRRLAKEVIQAGISKTTWFGWDGDRLTRVEDEQCSRETIYEPASFVPMALLEQQKGSPTATEAFLISVEADETTRAALDSMPKEMRQSLEATLQQMVSSGLPANAKAMLPENFDTSSADQTFAQTRERLQRETLPIKVRYFHCDHLGTPFALSDEQGKVVWQARFDPWGNVIEEQAEAGVVQPLRFQGQFFDEESGLHYNRHRYYDPRVGTYVTQDPIGLLAGANKYAYAKDPNGWVDPLGLDPDKCPSAENIQFSERGQKALQRINDKAELGQLLSKVMPASMMASIFVGGELPNTLYSISTTDWEGWIGAMQSVPKITAKAIESEAELAAFDLESSNSKNRSEIDFFKAISEGCKP